LCKNNNNSSSSKTIEKEGAVRTQPRAPFAVHAFAMRLVCTMYKHEEKKVKQAKPMKRNKTNDDESAAPFDRSMGFLFALSPPFTYFCLVSTFYI
jgi:hypothetical protein